MTAPSVFDMLLTMKLKAILFISAFYAAMCFAKPSFERYQPILERKPFGAIPDTIVNPVDPGEKATAAAQALLARQVNMSAMHIAPDGRVAVGITDLSAKPPANYYLAVGDSEGGWTLLDADYEEEIATLVKDGVKIDLQYGKGLVETPALGRPGLTAARGGTAPDMLSPTPPIPNAGGVGGRPLPGGLVREASAVSGGGSGGRGGPTAPRTTGTTAAANPAASYTELRDARLKEEQLKEKEQRDQLIRLAAATAAEELRKQKEEDAAAAGENSHWGNAVDPSHEDE